MILLFLFTLLLFIVSLFTRNHSILFVFFFIEKFAVILFDDGSLKFPPDNFSINGLTNIAYSN